MDIILKVLEPINVRPYDEGQMDLFPPSVRSLIANDHLCLVVRDLVNKFDLSYLYVKVSNEGNSPYHLSMMIKILFYAYAQDIFILRAIAGALKENVEFISLAVWQKPDFSFIYIRKYAKWYILLRSP